MATEVRVGHVRELAADDRMMVNVKGREIGIFRIDGTLYAVRNRCPHQGGPICTGGLFDELRAEVRPDRSIREYIGGRGCILACPYHGWEYDLRDGSCLWNPTFHLQTYQVRADNDGNLLIAM